MNLRLALKNKGKSEKSWQSVYEKEIEKRIRKRYSVNQELAILRQKDTKMQEFLEYNNFVESCKTSVKIEMGIL